MNHFNHSSSLVFAIALPLMIQSCGNQQQAPPPVPPAVVTTQVVTEGAANYYDEYPATITALNETELRPQVTGYITGIHFKDGQHVSQGQILYTIDQQTYQAGVSEAEANLAVAKANLRKVQKDADRYIALDKKDAIAKQVLDHALADLESAQMQVRAAEAGVRSVQTNLRYSKITAPFSGTIGISLVKLGASVSPGTTLLNTISSDNPVAADFYLDQQNLAAFEKLAANARTGDSVFTLLLPDGSEYGNYGTIASIDRAVDARTGTIRVRLSFANAHQSLRPGMSATVRVLHANGSHSVLIPYAAVTEQMGEYFVYRVTDSSTATQVKVKLGPAIGQNVIVEEGIAAGEKIVTEGLQRVKEGGKIQEGNAAAANAKGNKQ
ncbi:MAG: efflux RND transporter periplasmic adaptor subunit [Edaphocola sp.]